MTTSDVNTPVLWLITLFIALLLSNLAILTLIYFLVNIDLRTVWAIWLLFFAPLCVGWYIVKSGKLLKVRYPFRETAIVVLGLYVIAWIAEIYIYLHNVMVELTF